MPDSPSAKRLLHKLAQSFRLCSRRVYVSLGLGQMPHFVIIGAQKCGTTSLYNSLCRHALVRPALEKEVHFFDRGFNRGVDWYQAFFPASLPAFGGRRQARWVTGEATPYYVFHPCAASRMRSVLPDARLVLMLRNPVDRAYSHYQHEVKYRYETLSFEEALAAEPARLHGESDRILCNPHYNCFNHQHYSYLARGVYHQQVRAWLSHFSRDQLLIIRSEDFFREPLAVVERVIAFLGLPSPRSPLGQDYDRHDLRGEYTPMASHTRAYLVSYYKPHNRILSEYLGMDLGWDR